MGASVSIDRIQRHLEAIYDLDSPHRVSDFLVGDDELSTIAASGQLDCVQPHGEEQVLLLQRGDDLSLALYLSDAVQRQLRDGGSLQSHCHATEGVSHVLLLLWSGDQDRQLRRFDLELQAEVDKASTVLLLSHGSGPAAGRRLLARLFDSVEFHDSLSAAELRRYRTAHRLGAAYARELAALLALGVDHLLTELRRFYRLPPEAKRERAARAA